MKNFKRLYITMIVLCQLIISSTGIVHAQAEVLTGHQKDVDFGISFDIPDGMKGAGEEGMYMIGFEGEEGSIIIILDVEYTIEEMKEEFLDEVYLDDINSYYISGELTTIDDQTIAGKFDHTLHGKINGQAYIIGTVGPQSQAAIIIANPVKEPDMKRYEVLATQVLGSLKFTTPTFTYDD